MGYEKTYRNKYIKGGALIVGNSTIQGNLNVEGSMVFEDAISATSDVTINGVLKVVGNVNSSATITAKTGLASSSGTLDVKTATFRGLLTGSTKITSNNTLTATSKATVGLLLTASSKATITKTLTASSGFLGTANSSFSGTLKVDNALVMSSGLTEPIEAATTAVLTLTPNGISTISAPTTGAASWTLGTPVAGCSKTIVLTAAASTLSRRNVLAASGIAILTTGSTTANKIRMFKEGDSVVLRGLSASLWAVTNMRGVTLFSNSTTTT